MANHHWKTSKEPVRGLAVAWQHGQVAVGSALSLIKVPAVLWRCEHFCQWPCLAILLWSSSKCICGHVATRSPCLWQAFCDPRSGHLQSPSFSQNSVLYLPWISCSYLSLQLHEGKDPRVLYVDHVIENLEDATTGIWAMREGRVRGKQGYS